MDEAFEPSPWGKVPSNARRMRPSNGNELKTSTFGKTGKADLLRGDRERERAVEGVSDGKLLQGSPSGGAGTR